MEALFVLFPAFLVFGPRRFQDLLSSVARAKSNFEEVGRGFQYSLPTECSESSRQSENAEDNFPRGVKSGIALGNPTLPGVRNG